MVCLRFNFYLKLIHSKNEGVLREEGEIWKNMYEKNHGLPLRDRVTGLLIHRYQ